MFLERIPVRIRLSLGHAIWMALIFLAIGIGVYREVKESVNQSLDATLLASAQTIRDVHFTSDQKRRPRSHPRYWESLLDDFFGEQRVSIRTYAQLVDISGNIQAKTSNFKVRLPVSPMAVARAEQGRETFEDFRLKSGIILRQLTLPIFKNGQFTGELIQVGASLTVAYEALKSVQRMLWLTLSIGLGVTVVFGYLLTRWSFQTVTKITNSVAALGVSDDFSNRLKLPEAKDELRKLVITFNEMLGRIEDAFGRLRRFSGDVSHELRTPIAVLQGEAELALRRERSCEEYRQSLRSIVNETKQMSAIVEDLLLLARAQGKSIAIRWEDTDAHEFVESVVQSVKPLFEEKSLQLNVTNEAKPILRMAPSYLALALKNILLNAAKHSPKEGVVDLDIKSTYTETRFSVKDCGEGIPKDSLPYIFDVFYRADSARNRDSGGYGIGLSLARALVKLQDGNISVESEVGKGSTFTIVLPHSLTARK